MRRTIPSVSICRSCCISIFWEIAGMARSSSEKRRILPPNRWKRISSLFAEAANDANRIRSLVDDAYLEDLARAVAGRLGGRAGVAPRIFLKKLSQMFSIELISSRTSIHDDTIRPLSMNGK